MTFKEARAYARVPQNGSYLTLSKQKELGWLVERRPTQRSVYWVHHDGRIEPLKTDFARNWLRERTRRPEEERKK